MNDLKMSEKTVQAETPDWLLEIQNRSWEPEILISGISLTFLFILSNYIYNFHAMLIQDYGVFSLMIQVSYYTSVILLTGFKLVLIIHLILRGVWTGMVGLSYVFPEGVNRQKLAKINRNNIYVKPEVLVIRIEKLCSLLFSFIFFSITSVIGMYIFYIPITLLFVFGLDISYIRIVALSIIVLFFIAYLGVIIYTYKNENSRLEVKLNNSLLGQITSIYLTNIGKVKTLLLGLLYFLIIGSVSLPDISRFQFDNRESAEIVSMNATAHIDQDHYESSRNQDLRISKATIDTFHVTENSIRLFVSYYKQDTYTLKELSENPEHFNNFDMSPPDEKLDILDLYLFSIDDVRIAGLTWFSTEDMDTGQTGFITSIPLDAYPDGFHELKINKLYWSINKKEMELVENWAFIPFELSAGTVREPR